MLLLILGKLLRLSLLAAKGEDQGAKTSAANGTKVFRLRGPTRLVICEYPMGKSSGAPIALVEIAPLEGAIFHYSCIATGGRRHSYKFATRCWIVQYFNQCI